MALIRYPGSELVIGDPERIPLTSDNPGLDESLLDKALEGMILSPSGWRGVFALDGDEESPEERISEVHKVIVSAAAGVFADYLKEKGHSPAPVVILGMDTRPTGGAIADVMIRSLLAAGCEVRFAFITAAPEIMAYARSSAGTGFVYISASHNPIGHNGLKFGLTDGGVLPGPEVRTLIEAFRGRMADPRRIVREAEAVNRADRQTLSRVYTGASLVKGEAYRAYHLFTREVTTGPASSGPALSGAVLPSGPASSGPGSSGDGTEPGGGLFDAITRNLQKYPLGIAADFNGSARTLSIDKEFLTALGASFYAMNDKPRKIAHRIVPEGESLEPCRLFLEELHQKDPSVILGYMPDCDGDRGNLVFWDDRQGRARALEAQEVFALACVAELAHLVWTGELTFDNKGNAMNKAAVAVNDPTSMRIDRIARAFDVSVFRAEVGEANVVGLARQLREQGYTVRILGEGSAGGTITHPSAVRDPIDTLLALIKLLVIRSEGEKMGFFELWCDLSDQAEIYRPDFSLADIIAALPPFISTGTYTSEALLRVKTADHGLLKKRYQEVFLREWEERKDQLKSRYGISDWEACAYIGMEEKRGIADFAAAGRGGLKIIFTNTADHPAACIWMRGSGTEPVFRVMADVEGQDPRMERDLIEWQRRMVTEADSFVSEGA